MYLQDYQHQHKSFRSKEDTCQSPTATHFIVAISLIHFVQYTFWKQT